MFDLSKVFGDKGLIGSVMDVLKDTGVIKDPMQQAEIQTKLMGMEIQLTNALSQQMETINATMREEAKSEHWMQWSWRPSIGFTFCAILLNNYVLLPYFARYGLQPVVMPGEMWVAILTILGAASAFRGYTKSIEARKNGS